MLFLIKQFPLNFATGNGEVSVKVGAKVLPDGAVFFILSCDIALDFHE